jgi:hypothetical protein
MDTETTIQAVMLLASGLVILAASYRLFEEASSEPQGFALVIIEAFGVLGMCLGSFMAVASPIAFLTAS